MIKPTPIKRSSALVQFSKDHHFALLLIWKIRQGLRLNIEPSRIGNYINFFFENDLKEHFKEEEFLLFIHLDKDDHLRLRAEKDHHTLLLLNKKITDFPSSSLVEEFAITLEQHIRFEERILFAHLQNSFTESQLNFIAKKMASHLPRKEDEWQDVFWINPG
jgi:iron-sulfur cluster repair protein YtfE (RIC family)